MKLLQNAFRGLRLTEATNTLINKISNVCEKKGIRVNGDIVAGSVILRYPFERIAHAQFKEAKIAELTELLLTVYKPSDKFGNPLSRDDVSLLVREIFER